MGNFSEETIIKDHTLFDLRECVQEFGKLRSNRDKTKEVLSPSLTGISTSPCFHSLIYLCSEHDPTILKSVLQNALEKCTEAEKEMKEEKKMKEEESKKREEESKKREGEVQIGSGNCKKAKVQHLGQATPALRQLSQPKAIRPAVSEVRLPLDALKSGVTPNHDSQVASQASTSQSEVPVMAQASTSNRCQSPNDMYGPSPILSPVLNLASSSEDPNPSCDKGSTVGDIQDWTGSEYGLDSDEDMEYDSDVHGEDCTVQDDSAGSEGHDCILATENVTMSPETTSNGSEMFVPNPVFAANQSTKATSEVSSMPTQLRRSVTAPPPSQEVGLTNSPPKTQTPTEYEIELGLVRGEEKIKRYIMKECFDLSDDYRPSPNKKWFSKGDDLRELLPICRRLPSRIVKVKLLEELESRIVVPGQKTAIPSTADLFDPFDILDALQSIKLTTLNAKVNRAYGQMRLYKSVQGQIGSVNYVLDTALKHGVAPHRIVLDRMSCRSVGNEKERREKKTNFIYEYDAGRKWLDVAEWFGGEGIVLVFATAGVWNQNLFSKCLPKQC